MTNTNGSDTRLAILRAAETLFAAKGIDSVSLREIATVAGQGNNSAVLYHFTSKLGLLNALLERHSDPIQRAWIVTLQHMEAEGRDSLDELVGLLVRPLVQKLDDPDGGTSYLLIVAQLVGSRTFPIMDFPATSSPGVVAVIDALMQHAGPGSDSIQLLRMIRVADVLYGSIAAYQRLNVAAPAVDRDEFVNDLIDSICALVRAGRTTHAPRSIEPTNDS